MRVIVQRSGAASVTVDGRMTGEISHGLVCLVGFTAGDGEEQLQVVADKIVNLRIFADEAGKMNRSLLQTGGEILSISQFTVYGDCRKGRRPNFMAAAPADIAEQLYHDFNTLLKSYGVNVQTGIFGAEMQVSLMNDGPVTLIVERE